MIYVVIRGADITLKDIRAKYNLTQKEVIEAGNIPLGTYKRYEKGKNETSLKHLKMMDILD